MYLLCLRRVETLGGTPSDSESVFPGRNSLRTQAQPLHLTRSQDPRCPSTSSKTVALEGKARSHLALHRIEQYRSHQFLPAHRCSFDFSLSQLHWKCARTFQLRSNLSSNCPDFENDTAGQNWPFWYVVGKGWRKGNGMVRWGERGRKSVKT